MNFKKQNIDSVKMSSWNRKAIGSIAAISLPLFLAACSDDSSSSSNDTSADAASWDETISLASEAYRDGLDFVLESDDLGTCDESNEGTVTAVLADTSLHFCYDGKWNDKDRLYAYDEDDPLYECAAESEGDSIRTKLANVDGETVYDYWFCEDGKWVSYFGAGETDEPRVYSGSVTHSEKGTMKDARDGKTYKTVKIYSVKNSDVTASQTWMAQNLNYEADSSYCYDNKLANCDKYGRLYAWTDKVCPEGWHVPSRDEWDLLFKMAGDLSAYHLKSKDGWEKYISHYIYGNYWSSEPVYAGEGDDKFGFNVLPGGVMEYDAEENGHSEDFFIKWNFYYEGIIPPQFLKDFDPSLYHFKLVSYGLSTETDFWTSSTETVSSEKGKKSVAREYVFFKDTYKEGTLSNTFVEKDPKYIRCIQD